VEGEVEGAVFNQDDVVAGLANPTRDGVSMACAPRERAEDEEIERPLQEHWFGGGRHVRSPEWLRGR
jgi:hypothetical protein